MQIEFELIFFKHSLLKNKIYDNLPRSPLYYSVLAFL